MPEPALEERIKRVEHDLGIDKRKDELSCRVLSLERTIEMLRFVLKTLLVTGLVIGAFWFLGFVAFKFGTLDTGIKHLQNRVDGLEDKLRR